MSQLATPLKRLSAVMGLLVAAIVVAAIVSVFLPRGQAPHSNWIFPPSIPVLSVGSDQRIFVTAAQTMAEGGNPFHANYNSPPFTSAVFFPFIFLSDSAAYRVQFYLTLAENCGTLVVLVALTSRLFPAGVERPLEQVAMSGMCLLTVTIFQFFGYPLEFALERGNYDSLALLAMAVGLWLLARPRPLLWAPTIFLSLAVHLKVYPAVLLGIPLWAHRERAIAPLVAVNAALLFCFGVEAGWQFLAGLFSYSRHPYVWAGNHSAASFGELLLRPLLVARIGGTGASSVAFILTLCLPLGFWLHGVVRLVRDGFSSRNAVLGFALSVPLMCVLPSVSNDYKLVVTVVPALVCLVSFSDRAVSDGGWKPFAALIATLICLVAIGQSILFTPILFTANKFPALLLLQGLVHHAVVGNRSLSSS